MLVRFAAIACVVIVSVSCQAGSAVPVGSLASTFGTVRVSGVAVPNGTAVFSGDIIETGASKAVFTFSDGDAVLVGANATVRVSRTGNVPSVEVLKGMSRVQLRSRDLRLLASNWTVQAKPSVQTGLAIADVLRDADGVISLNVKEGELIAKSPAEKQVTLVAAGRPALLLPAAAVPPSAGSPPSPQGGSSNNKALTVGAYALAAAAIAVGAAAIAADDTTDTEARSAAAAARQSADAARQLAQTLQAQIDALRAANDALSRQVTALTATVNALATQVARFQEAGPLLGQLSSLVAQLSAQSATQAQIAAQIAALGPTPDPAQLAALTAALQASAANLSSIAGQVDAVARTIAQRVS